MARMIRLLASLSCVGIVLMLPPFLSAQSPPPDPEVKTRPQESAQVLGKEESLIQVRKARDLFRLGGLPEADRALRGPDFTVGFAGIDPRLAGVMRGVKHYNDGKLRAALNEARDAFNRPAPQPQSVVKSAGCGKSAPRNAPTQTNTDNVLPDAALLRAFIYARAGIIPLCLDWSKRTQAIDPNLPGAATLLKVYGNPNDYTKVETYSHPTYSSFLFDVWHGNDAAKQHVVVVIRKDDAFLGAIALEPTKSGAFDLKFFDLDAPPLSLREFESKPEDDEILKLASSLNPAQGPGRFTIMRAELEALASQRDGIMPFAASWADYAGRSSSLLENSVRQPLREGHADQWKPQTVTRIGKFEVHGFMNTTPADAAAPSREHFHFALIGGNGKYVGSMVVNSRVVAGEEVFALNWLWRGQVELVDIFADPPSLAAATERIKAFVITGVATNGR